MRLKITENLHGSIDGVQLDRFEVGRVYDVGTSIGCYLMAVGAAQPVADERPALVIPLDELPSANLTLDSKVVPLNANATANDRQG